jgi:hypothetical protein
MLTKIEQQRKSNEKRAKGLQLLRQCLDEQQKE